MAGLCLITICWRSYQRKTKHVTFVVYLYPPIDFSLYFSYYYLQTVPSKRYLILSYNAKFSIGHPTYIMIPE